MTTTDDATVFGPGAASLNEWEQKVLHTAAHEGVLAACRESYADGMNWEQKYGHEVLRG